MSDMHFREPNQVKWQGSRPGHNGVQVIEDGDANNVTDDIYTVLAGKRLYLCGWSFSCWGVAYSTGAHLWLWTVVVLDRRELIAGVHAANSALMCSMSYWPPIELVGGDIVRLISDNVNSICHASIHGWTE